MGIFMASGASATPSAPSWIGRPWTRRTNRSGRASKWLEMDITDVELRFLFIWMCVDKINSENLEKKKKVKTPKKKKKKKKKK